MAQFWYQPLMKHDHLLPHNIYNKVCLYYQKLNTDMTQKSHRKEMHKAVLFFEIK